MTIAAPLRHDALLYSSEQEFLDQALPFVRDGLANAEPVLVVSTEANLATLEQALGDESDAVTYVPAGGWYCHPAHTIARYRRALDERLDEGAARVRVIGEVQFGEAEPEQRDWVRYEAALNRAFASAPVWILCPYDLRALPAPVSRSAVETHPHVLRGGQRSPNAAYTAPEHVAQRLGTAPSLGRDEAPAAAFDVAGTVAPVRAGLRALAAKVGMSRERTEELTVAVNEAVTNALLHGRPPVRVELFTADTTLECAVTDAGATGPDPLAGFTPPPAADEPQGGMGLWLARQLCERVELLQTGAGTAVLLTVRLR